jgi:Cytochrome c554 and c-prime
MIATLLVLSAPRRRVLLTAAIVLCAGVFAHAQAPSTDGYAWGTSCKSCHVVEWDSWGKTKHATAIRRVSSEKDNPAGCVGCHVTPAGATLLDQDVNANIQCEGCHGPGKAHVAAATGGAAKPGLIVRKPAEEVCVTCHTPKSPHFKFFSYPAMAPLSHQVPGK